MEPNTSTLCSEESLGDPDVQGGGSSTVSGPGTGNTRTTTTSSSNSNETLEVEEQEQQQQDDNGNGSRHGREASTLVSAFDLGEEGVVENASIMEATAGQGIAQTENARDTMGIAQKTRAPTGSLHFFNPGMRNTSLSPQPNINRKLEKVDQVPGLQESDGAEKEIETMEGLDSGVHTPIVLLFSKGATRLRLPTQNQSAVVEDAPAVMPNGSTADALLVDDNAYGAAWLENDDSPGAWAIQNGVRVPAANDNYNDDFDWDAYNRATNQVSTTVEGQPNSTTDGLATATPVNEPSGTELPLAVPEDEGASHQRDKDRARWRRWRCCLCGTSSVALFLVVGFILFFVLGSDSSDSMSSSQTGARDKLSPEQYMLKLLPNYTIDEIDLDNYTRNVDANSSTGPVMYVSPQTRAFNWTMKDPSFSEYEDWRLVQRFALACLYYSTGGDSSWYIKKDWLSYEVNEKKWYRSEDFYGFAQSQEFDLLSNPMVMGIYLAMEGSELEHLWLNSNGLNGTLPRELFLLSSLKTIDFTDNNLVGTLPDQIGDLSRLEFASLSTNEITGKLPTTIGRLKSSLLFAVEDNQFTGEIPSQIGLLDAWVISLSFNLLSGVLPSELGLCPRLLWFWANHNRITGTIPSELGYLTTVQVFEMSDNQFNGTLPSDLGNLFGDTLEFVDDYARILQEKLGLGEGFLSREIKGAMTQGLTTGQVQKGFGMGSNLLIGQIPTEFGLWVQQDWVDLEENLLTGSIPSELGMLTQLRKLSLGRNPLSSSIPTEIGKLSVLDGLKLRETPLSGPIPSELGLSTTLSGLNLEKNKLTGQIPTELGLLSFVGGSYYNSYNSSTLNLRMNLLSGPIPTELGMLSRLDCLYLHDNQLTGAIPSELGLLSYLQELALFNNHLTGSIPSEFGMLTNLRRLWLGNNSLSSSIPTEMGLLSLEFLDIP